MRTNRPIATIVGAAIADVCSSDRPTGVDTLRRGAPRCATLFRTWRRRSRERQALARFDERMLKDIGLTRADAEFLINRPFWRE
jgi:uncharacterized protein YjiS (DUF1127 family)